LTAPKAGILLVGEHPWEDRKFQVGDVVQPGWTVVELPELAAMRVEATVSDVDDGRVAAGAHATCTLDAWPDQPLSGTVREVAPVAQEVGQKSLRRAFKVVVALDRTDPERMRPGMSVKVEVRGTPVASQLTAPRAALDPHRRLPTGGERPIESGHAMRSAAWWPGLSEDRRGAQTVTRALAAPSSLRGLLRRCRHRSPSRRAIPADRRRVTGAMKAVDHPDPPPPIGDHWEFDRRDGARGDRRERRPSPFDALEMRELQEMQNEAEAAARTLEKQRADGQMARGPPARSPRPRPPSTRPPSRPTSRPTTAVMEIKPPGWTTSWRRSTTGRAPRSSRQRQDDAAVARLSENLAYTRAGGGAENIARMNVPSPRRHRIYR
jgi:hypothetical protein